MRRSAFEITETELRRIASAALFKVKFFVDFQQGCGTR